MSSQAQAHSETVNICASRLAGVHTAPQTFFRTENINTKNPDLFIDQLRETVELITHCGLTVRKASAALFAEAWFWLRIAVGPYASFGADQTVVTEHKGSHTLFGAFSTPEATLIVANKSSTELLEKHRHEEAAQHRQQLAEAVGLASTQEQLPRILKALQDRILQASDPLTCEDAQAMLTKIVQASPREVTMFQLSSIGAVLNVELADLLIDALP